MHLREALFVHLTLSLNFLFLKRCCRNLALVCLAHCMNPCLVYPDCSFYGLVSKKNERIPTQIVPDKDTVLRAHSGQFAHRTGTMNARASRAALSGPCLGWMTCTYLSIDTLFQIIAENTSYTNYEVNILFIRMR